MNKKGLSVIVTVMLLILIMITATAIIWGVINKTIEEELGSSEVCYKIIDKVKINPEYTCYTSSKNVIFSVGIGDIEIDELIVSISNEEDSKTFRLSSEEKTIEDLINYPSGSSVKLPGKNSGSSYIASNVPEDPYLIQILPIIGQNDCGVSDSLTEIPSCYSLGLE